MARKHPALAKMMNAEVKNKLIKFFALEPTRRHSFPIPESVMSLFATAWWLRRTPQGSAPWRG